MRIREFAAGTAARMAAPEWRGLALQLFLLLAVTNAILAMHAPIGDAKPDPAFAAAGAVRTIGLFSMSVALLRTGTGSPRGRWAVDAGFWLYLGLSLVQFVLLAGATLLVGDASFSSLLVVHGISTLLTLPLWIWQVAAASERPTAWKPRFERIGEWLPSLLVLAAPLVLIAAAHGATSLSLIEMAGTPSFWVWAFIDGVASTFLLLATLALQITVYRSVAEG